MLYATSPGRMLGSTGGAGTVVGAGRRVVAVAGSRPDPPVVPASPVVTSAPHPATNAPTATAVAVAVHRPRARPTTRAYETRRPHGRPGPIGCSAMGEMVEFPSNG